MEEHFNLFERIEKAEKFIRSKTDFQVRFGMVLGTGLGSLIDDMEIEAEISYSEIPYFPQSTVQSHAGKMFFGRISGKNVVVFAGRWHYYEGYSTKDLTFPIRVMKALGVKDMIFTNASGSINSTMRAGDIVFVEDHINLMPENPLRGENDERLGPRFPDMKGAYNVEGNARAMEIANELGYRAHSGVYVGLQGPNLETPAEYRFLHRIGGDIVGMSTVPEVLVAVHSGIRPMVASIVSNCSYPISEIKETSLEDVISTVNQSAWKLKNVLVKYIEQA